MVFDIHDNAHSSEWHSIMGWQSSFFHTNHCFLLLASMLGEMGIRTVTFILSILILQIYVFYLSRNNYQPLFFIQ